MNVQVRDTPAGTTLGQRLRQAREAARYSRTQLSTATNIPSKSIEKFEADEQEPSVSRLIALSNVLGASLDALMGRSSQAPPAPSPQPASPVLPNIEPDPVEDLLSQLDDLRGTGFQDAQRGAMALVEQLKAELRHLEARELISLARERGIDSGTCPSALDLQNGLAADATEGQAACAEVEERVIDTALLGADLPSLGAETLAKFANQLKLKGGGMLGWNADDEELVPALRASLRQLAYAGKGVDLAAVEAPPARRKGFL